MKKFLSILLAITLMLSTLTVGFAGAVELNMNETTLKTKSKGIITLSVTPEDERYAWGDTVVFNVDVTNNTGTDCEKVKVRAQANKAKFFYDGESNTVTVDSIKAGETKTVQIKVKSSEPNILQRLIVLPIYYILDFVSPMAFRDHNFDATALVRVGAFKYRFGFDVTDGKPAEAKPDEPVEPDKPDVPVEPDKEVTISFNLNYAGATATIPAQTVKAGEKAAPVTAPVRNGYTFMGWFTNPSCEEEYRFSFLFPLYDDLMVYAKWEEVSAPSTTYTVSFNLNYDGATTIRPQTVAAGRTARAVADPTRNGYEFLGWFTDASCEEEFRFSFNMPINSNLTLYAKWQAVSGEEPDLDEDLEIEIYSFDVNCYDVLINTETLITFTAEIFSENVLGEEDVYVIDENGNLIGYMNDNGVAGDEEAEDGIYTLTANLSSQTVKIVKYYVMAGNVESEYLPISYYRHISEEEMSELEAIQAEIDSLMSAFLDEEGYLIESKYDDAIRAIERKLNSLKADGKVQSFHVDREAYCVEIVASSGLEYYYTFALKNSDAGSGTSALMSYQPYKNDRFNPYDSYYQGLSDEATDGSCRYVANAIEGFIFNSMTSGNEQNSALDSNHDREEVSLDALKHLAAADVVSWHGHGGYSSTRGSFMATGEFYTSELEPDLQAHRIVLCGNENRVAITGEFVRTYVGNLTGKFIYLGTCSSGRDLLDNVSSDTTYELGRAFADKGATVIANSNTIKTAYNTRMERSVFEALANVSGVTNKYNTLSEALENAQTINGATDSQGTYAFIYPYTATARNYRLKEAEGSLSGIIKSATNNNPVNNALIRVYKNNSLLKQVRTTTNGNYSIELPAGEYTLKISAGQYKPAKVLVTVSEGRITYVETFLLVKSSQTSGNASGRTINAITGERLQDVTIRVRRNWNNKTGAVLKTLSSDSNGIYTMSYNAGYYTLECTKEGFMTTYKNIIVSTNDTSEQNISISPVLGEGDYRVVLTWGANPSDLDSHLFGTNADGSSYHVYYSNKNGYNATSERVANLDVDDTTSYGPETTTFTTDTTGTYEFYVDWYSGSGTWATSGGKVEVYRGAQLLGTYYVPNVNNRSGSWKVFTISNGAYSSYNIIQDHDIY